MKLFMSCCQLPILRLRTIRYPSGFSILSYNTGTFFRTFCIMPKASSGAKKSQSKVQVVVENGAVYTDASGHVVIKVHAKPGAKNNGITDIGSEEVGVQISAAPVDGEANIELVKYLAKIVGVRKGDISLEKGSKSRTKTLVVTAAGISSVDVIAKTSYGIHHWTPPKGHLDPGETDKEAAIRETVEEAGVAPADLAIHWEFKRIMNYSVKGENKRVTYWLAELKNEDTPVILSDEHQDFRWLPLKEACQFAGYEDMKKLFEEAETFLNAGV